MTTYIYTTLDNPGSSYTIAWGINSTEVVGYYANAYRSNGFVYQEGSFTTLNEPSGISTILTGVNTSGEIIGFFDDTAYTEHGFLYAGGNYTIIDEPLHGQLGTRPLGINTSGQIVGIFWEPGDIEHGFLYSNGAYTVLDDPLGTGTYPMGINASGEIVGRFVGDGVDQGFVYSQGQYTTLDDPLGVFGTVPQGINDQGQIVGYYIDASNVLHGFLYADGTFTTLNNPPGAVGVLPTAINDAGQITGYYFNGINNEGFIATPDPGPSITQITPSVVERGQTTEIGTVTSGITGDTLTLQQTSGNGTVALQLVNGVEEVIYTAPSQISASTVDTVSYTIADQYNDVASGSNAIQLDAGPSITAVVPALVKESQTTQIGTVAPGLTADTLSLQQTSGSGTVALQLVNGVEEVIYTAPSTLTASTLDTVSYTITDQYKDAAATGSSTVPVAPSGDTVYVGARGQSTRVGNGNSAIDGRAGNETITAGNGADVIFGGSNDTITAGNSADTIYSGPSSSIAAGNANDAVTAGANSSITLGNGNDTVIAGANSAITVGNGNDNIFAGTNDLISIGTGHDTVAFGESPNPIAVGNETINGFNPAHDVLQFNPMLLSNYATAQVGANTVIQIDSTNSVTLDNVTATALSANNFHFS
jgi:probable HAF family extracellular repeat protein